MGRVKVRVIDEVRVTVSGGSRPEPGGCPQFSPRPSAFQGPIPESVVTDCAN